MMLGIESIDDIVEDENFINRTDYNLLLLGLDGSVKYAPTPYAPRIFENGQMRILLDSESIQALNSFEYESKNYRGTYNYRLADGSVSANWWSEVPTKGHPVVFSHGPINYVIMLDDEWSRKLLRMNNLKELARKYINYHHGERTFSQTDLKYINLSNNDLFMVMNGKIIKLPSLMNGTSEEAKEQIMIGYPEVRNVYNSYSKDYEIILSFANSISDIKTEEDERKVSILLYEKGDHKSGDPLRPKDVETDLLMLFYSWAKADDFLKNTKNSTNYIVDLAADYFDQDKEEAVKQVVVEDKKKMTAVAKVCVALVSTGVVYAGVRTAIELIAKKKSELSVVKTICRKAGIAHMTNVLKGTAIKKSMMVALNMAGPTAIGTAIAQSALTPTLVASAVNPILAPIAVGAALVAGVVTIVKNRDEIKDFLDDVKDKIVEGVEWVKDKLEDAKDWIVEKAEDAWDWVKEKASSVKDWFCDLFGI